MKLSQLKMTIFFLILFSIPGFLFSAITKGPYLVSPEQNSMTIMWESDNDETAKLIYWKNEDNKLVKYVSSFDSNNNFLLYRVILKGLKKNQMYHYQVIMGNDSSESYFVTSPIKGEPFTFVAIGDSRTNHAVFSAIAKDVEKISPRLIISMGDLVGRGKNFDEWNPHFFDSAKSVINHIPHISTLGDHETAGDYNGYNFYYFFRNGINTDSMWFSYDFGDIHFISLDYRRANDNGMIKWFENDLKKSYAKWKIVYLHRPQYNLGGHRSHWGTPIWQKLFRNNKIDIVFAGHSHLYERFYPMRPSTDKTGWPVTHITTGGAGAGLYNAVENEHLAITKSVNHLMIGSVNGDTLKFVTKLLDGKILDKFEMIKHNGEYDKSYLKLVKAQEGMDIYMTFASRLLVKFNEIPSMNTSVRKVIKFDTAGIPEDIPFKLFLAKESSKYYSIEPFESILKKGEDYQGMITLYAKGKVEIKSKYFFHPVFFNVSYKYNGIEVLVKGRESRYYPSKKGSDKK